VNVGVDPGDVDCRTRRGAVVAVGPEQTERDLPLLLGVVESVVEFLVEPARLLNG